jgi:hypothetical protein
MEPSPSSEADSRIAFYTARYYLLTSSVKTQQTNSHELWIIQYSYFNNSCVVSFLICIPKLSQLYMSRYSSGSKVLPLDRFSETRFSSWQWQGFYSLPAQTHCLWDPLHFLSNRYRGHRLEWNQLVNPATSSPADDVHHYVIPPSKVTIDQ